MLLCSGDAEAVKERGAHVAGVAVRAALVVRQLSEYVLDDVEAEVVLRAGLVFFGICVGLPLSCCCAPRALAYRVGVISAAKVLVILAGARCAVARVGLYAVARRLVFPPFGVDSLVCPGCLSDGTDKGADTSVIASTTSPISSRW